MIIDSVINHKVGHNLIASKIPQKIYQTELTDVITFHHSPEY